MSGAVRWSAGVAASLAAHAAAGAALLIWLRPGDVPNQPMPQSELEIAAYALERTQARPARPDPQQAAAADATGNTLATGAIPTSRARPARPDTRPVPAQEADTVRTPASAPAAAQLAAATPDAETQQPRTPDATAVAPARPDTVTSAAQAPQAAPAQAVTPVSETAAPAVAAAAPLAAATAPAASLAATAAPAASLAAAPAPVADIAAAPAPATLLAAATEPVARIVQSPAPAASIAATVSVPAAVLAATARPADPVPVAAPRAQKLTPGTSDIQVAALETPAATPITVTATDAPRLAGLLPTPTPAAIARPDAVPAPAAIPDTAPVAAAIADRQPVAAATPDAPRVKAALAFPGGTADPVSLAAFQSFMQPGDAAPGGDPVRDGVAGLLSQVPCSRLQVGFDPDTTTLTVNGHIPDGDLRGSVVSALQSRMGADIAVSDNMLILPRPQCGALSGIASVGLPQSTDQFTNPLVIGDDTHARVFRFTDGDLLSLDMTAPDYDAAIYLDYFDADGNVLHLEPNEYSALRFAPAKSAQRIGARTATDQGLKLVIGPPYGQEIAVAFAASHPLYDGLRPLQEPAAPYLDWLRDRVAAARAENPDFKGEWVYFFVTSSER